MRTKTIHTIFLTLITVFTFCIAGFAAEGVIYFSDPESAKGSTVEVSMSIEAQGTTIGDATVTLKYPADSLTFIEGTNASGGAGTIRIHGTGNQGDSGKCRYTLKFQTPNPGNFTVNIDTYEVYDADGAVITITHVGSSGITVTAEEGVSGDCSLSVLSVNPGTLTPEFAKDTHEYEVHVGLSVEKLTINALSTETDAKVSVVNNENLAEGENQVIVAVTAPDGISQQEYLLHVIKEEGGDEGTVAEETTEAPTEDFADGVELLSKGKCVTIMTPGDDVEIPEGFKESAISIDGQKVQGWIWDAEGTPEYCVVYGMNDQGEVNFYRYDMNEKTIQRYFADPNAKNKIAEEEYQAALNEVNELTEKTDNQKLLLIILGIVLALLLVIIIYLLIRITKVSRKAKQEDNPGEEEDDLQGEIAGMTSETDADETRIVARSERRKRAEAQASDATIVIKKDEIEAREPESQNLDDGFEELDF